jgi:hypothetical protein
MSASIVIEQESGTFTQPIHGHNGYYAGDFSTPRTDLSGEAWNSPRSTLEW